MNQLRALLLTCPAELREQLRHLSPTKLGTTCARLRPVGELADPEQAIKTALRRLARRHQHLTEEVRDADRDLWPLIAAAGPRLLALQGVGIDVAGQERLDLGHLLGLAADHQCVALGQAPDAAGHLLTSAGDNPERLPTEAAFAQLCGVAPIPASSGRTIDTDSTAAATARPITHCPPSL